MGQLNPPGAVFLSASVPDPDAPNFVLPGDAAAISAAISALLYVTLGRRKLVWGGHPAITPMIWSVAEDMGIDYGQWVELHQSLLFEDEFPEETRRFRNVVFTDAIGNDRDASLRAMRERMINGTDYCAAVFIGGMSGINDEYAMLRTTGKDIKIVPIASTGGATVMIAEAEQAAPALLRELDYVRLLFAQLDIDPNELRYRTLEEQPAAVADRIKRPTSEHN